MQDRFWNQRSWKGWTMESISENAIEKTQHAGSKNKDICPALILADVIVCCALGRLYEPSSRQINECCVNEYHVRCSLRHSAWTPAINILWFYADGEPLSGSPRIVPFRPFIPPQNSIITGRVFMIRKGTIHRPCALSEITLPSPTHIKWDLLFIE